MAQQAGVSASTVARIERGRTEPTLDLLLRLVHGCALEMHIALKPATGGGSPAGLSFEARLGELLALSEVSLEARQNREQ